MTVLTIAKREVTTMFFSPIAYFVLFLFLLVTGFLFTLFVFLPGQLSEVRTLIDYSRFGLFFIIPAMTMSLLAEEYRSGRIEMLRTSPITELDLVLGKYIGAMFFYLILVACTFIYLIMLWSYGRPDWGATFSAYVGLVFLGMMFVSIGLFFSACTRNQIVALLATLLTLGFLTFAGALATLIPGGRFWDKVRAVMNYLNVGTHVEYFSKGEIMLSHCVYFLGFTLLFLFLTYLILESRKWR